MRLRSIREHSRRRQAANDDNLPVIARVEQIAATVPGLSEQLRPVVAVVRDGAITRSPGEVFFYLLGALHVLHVADDEFFALQDALCYLLPNHGAESWTHGCF